MNDQERGQRFISLSHKIHNEIGQADADLFVQDGEIDKASEYLLGAVDRLWSEGV